MSELEQFRFFEFLNECRAYETELAAKTHWIEVHVAPESSWGMGYFGPMENGVNQRFHIRR
jgi:hypothetical protein